MSRVPFKSSIWASLIVIPRASTYITELVECQQLRYTTHFVVQKFSLWEVWDALGYRRVNPHKRGSVDSLYAATSWKVDVLEKIAAKYASTSLGFISQVASVLE